MEESLTQTKLDKCRPGDYLFSSDMRTIYEVCQFKNVSNPLLQFDFSNLCQLEERVVREFNPDTIILRCYWSRKPISPFNSILIDYNTIFYSPWTKTSIDQLYRNGKAC